MDNFASICNIEEKVNITIDLLEVAKSYCEFHYDKANEVSNIFSILEIVLNNQKLIRNELDSLS